MAYCRFGTESDVYLYESINGGWDCCRCELDQAQKAGTIITTFYTIDETIDHMKEHRNAGHKVPESVFEKLLNERANE